MAPSTQRIGLLEAARQLMLAKGYWGTTVDEICAAAGVTKGSFYHHFSTKDDLGLALIDHYFTGVEAVLLTGDFDAVKEPRARLDAFLAHAVRVARSPQMLEGCILGCFTLDLAEVAPKMQEALSVRFENLAARLEALIQEATTHSTSPKPVDAGAFARQFISVLEGGLILVKAHGRPDLLAEGIETYGLMLRSCLGEPR